jgi:uncharacterized membrane protein
VVLLAVGLPIARLLFPMFPDRGWGLARTLALVAAAYPVWLGASLELFRFRAIWVILALVAIGAIGWRFAPRRDDPGEESASRRVDRGPRAARLLNFSTPRLGCMHAEVAFWLVFLIFLAFRLITPDSWHPFWGGEKPMEFAQINAIARSAYFPPYDPWYSDGYLNYYYYGFYLVAFLLKATGIPAELGFNLALPTFMGLLASGGFTVAAALARGVTRSSLMALLGGWSGALALCLLGNLSALHRLLEGIPAQFDPFLFWTWGGSRAIDDVITEFPYFTGLYADLHAHVVALPLTVATIAVCLAIATTRLSETPRVPIVARLTALALLLGTLSATNAWDVPVYAGLGAVTIFMVTTTVKPISRRLSVLASGLLVSLGGAWFLFLPFHLHFVALFSQLALVRDPTDLVQFLSHLGGLTIVTALGLVVLLLPRRHENVLNIALALGAVALGALGVIALSTQPAESVQTAGAVLVVAAIGGPPLVAAWLVTRCADEGSRWGTRLMSLVIPVAALLAAASAFTGRAVFGLLIALGAAAAVGWLRLDRRDDRFVCLLAAAALFTASGVEIVVVADDLIGTTAYRMNTVFKFYNQVWVLLSLAGAALFALMVHRGRVVTRFAPTDASGDRVTADDLSSSPSPHLLITPSPSRLAWARLGASAAFLVVLASLLYPLVATGPRLAQRFTPGTPLGALNAFAWMQTGTVPVVGSPAYQEIAYAGDADAIAWFFANVSGSPVVAEASIGPYRCNGSRISSATGLPTIIGWERHEQQQRYPETLPSRVADVRTLYTSPDTDEKASILRRYNVEYVVVGDLERIYPIANNECTPSGSQAGIDAFDAMVGTTLEVAHASRGTTIYHVLPLRPA